MKKVKEFLIKNKKIILVSFIGTLVPVLIGFNFFEIRNLLIFYTLLCSWVLIFAIQKDSVLKILPKLFYASFLSVIFIYLFVFIRVQIMELIRNGHFEFRHMFDLEIFIPAIFLLSYIFFFGLSGIVVYGFYNLYKKKIKKYFIYFAPLLITTVSLLKVKLKYGGTIVSRIYGWPEPMIAYQVKDIVDNFHIDKWIFSSMHLRNVFINYFLYLLFLFLAVKIFKILRKKFNFHFKSFDFLIILSLIIITPLVCYNGFEEQYIKSKIKESRYCNIDSDCQKIDFTKMGCFVSVNKERLIEINKLIKIYPFGSGMTCLDSRFKAACLKNFCTARYISPISKEERDKLSE